MNTKNSPLKIIAREAKTRLRLIAKDSKFSLDSFRTKVLNQEDSALYNKVCKILNRDTITINPINELIDFTYYNNLSSDAKQRYIMYLSDKYVKLKARFYSENVQRVV